MDASHKRRLPSDEDDAAPASASGEGPSSGDNDGSKRARTGGAGASFSSTALIRAEHPEESALALLSDAGKFAPGRTSSLEAPIMLLTGHAAPVYAIKFAPDGNHLASAGKDRDVFIWNVFGECATTQTLKGHKNAVLDLHWSPDGQRLFTASADKNAALWDLETGARLKTFAGHTKIVNCCSPARRGMEMLVTGSDDGSMKLWDARKRTAAASFSCKYPVLGVAFADDLDSAFAAGVDNVIRRWDLRRGGISWSLPGHTDTVTGLSLSPDGTQLLSISMDSTVRAWDVRPFVRDGASRQLKVYSGSVNNFEMNMIRCSWGARTTSSGVALPERVGAGSAARMVCVWDAETAKLVYQLPGHSGVVNEVVFHPTEPIVASCGSDKKIYLGELAA